MKSQHEFFPVSDVAWRTVQDGVSERVLSQDEDNQPIMTRIVRWVAGLDTTPAGVIQHDYFEEVYILEGELHDLTLDRAFRVGDYAARQPGMPHGPYRTDSGCVMLEIRHLG